MDSLFTSVLNIRVCKIVHIGMQSMQNSLFLVRFKPIFALKAKKKTPIGIGIKNVTALTLGLKENSLQNWSKSKWRPFLFGLRLISSAKLFQF